MTELFPPELCANEDFLKAAKTIEQTREISTNILPHLADHRLLLPSPAEVAEKDDFAKYQRRQIAKVLKTLTYREREVIKLRYGLGDGNTYTLEEVGHIFKVTCERIRGIEANALRKLQQDHRKNDLKRCLEQ